jgi:hypothetical protein
VLFPLAIAGECLISPLIPFFHLYPLQKQNNTQCLCWPSYDPRYAAHPWHHSMVHAVSTVSATQDGERATPITACLPCSICVHGHPAPPSSLSHTTQHHPSRPQHCNFTTSHPIFLNITNKIHNIPISSHTFLEADLDVRIKEDQALPLKFKCACSGKLKKHSHPAATNVHFHPIATCPMAKTKTKTKTEAEAKQFDKYFAPPQVPSVTMMLLISLVLMLTNADCMPCTCIHIYI